MKGIRPSRLLLFGALAGLGCAIDLATKRWIFDLLGMPTTKPTIWLWNDVFGLTTSLNEGALFGIGQGRVALFAILSIVALVGILYWLFISGAAEDGLLTSALGLVTAGILGNLYDRLGLPGLIWPKDGSPVYAVRDWLNFQLINWPIFNVADSLLVCGAGLLIFHAFRAELQARSAQSGGHSSPSSMPESTAGESAGPRQSS